MERRGYSPSCAEDKQHEVVYTLYTCTAGSPWTILFPFLYRLPSLFLLPTVISYIFLPTLHLRRIQSMKLLSFREHVYPLSCSQLYTGTVACWLNLALVLCILSQSILFSNSIHLQVSVSGFLASYGLFILPYFFYPSCPQGLQLLCIIKSLVLYSYSLQSLSVYLSL